MNMRDILQLIQHNLLFVCIAAAFICNICIVVYYIILRKRTYRYNRPNKRRIIAYILLIVYILMILALTVINRGAGMERTINLSLFSSYREAWNQFSIWNWQLIFFNIAMFLPLGFLLPFIHNRFKEVSWTMLVACLFTMLIECLQLVGKLGVFELDDMFNNLLGALIGFGFIKVFLVKGWRLRLPYLMPVLLVMVTSLSGYLYYMQQPFGNLAINPSKTVKMNDVTVITNLKFDEKRPEAVVYKAPKLTKEQAQQKAFQQFEQLTIDTSSIDLIGYENTAYYRSNGEHAYSITINYLDSSFELTDFTLIDVNYAETDEKTLLKVLQKMAIEVPKQAIFKEKGRGKYEWYINYLQDGDQLINGALTVEYFSDQTIKKANQSIVNYSKEAAVTLKSEQQAYEEIVAGHFNTYANNIKSIKITKVKQSFTLDSKGFYQPIYEFSSLIDGHKEIISIQAVD